MKPTTQLLRLARIAQPAAKPSTTAARERETLFERKRALERDLEMLAEAAEALPQQLEHVIAAIRRDSRSSPAAIAGSVVIRVLGAVDGDVKPVPLPKLRVTLVGTGGATAQAITDATGLAVVPMPRAAPDAPDAPDAPTHGNQLDPTTYHLTITASDGSEVAQVDGDPGRTHLIVLGDVPSLAGHAALGQGWLAAIDSAAASREGITQRAGTEIADLEVRTTRRMAAISKRLDLHFK
jgi:hypothetical protein